MSVRLLVVRLKFSQTQNDIAWVAMSSTSMSQTSGFAKAIAKALQTLSYREQKSSNSDTYGWHQESETFTQIWQADRH